MNDYNEEIDLSLAIQLQAQFEEELRVQRKKEEEKKKDLETVGHKWNAKWMSLPEPEQDKLSVSLVDPCWEHLDPTPNIFDLFLTFNHQFFWGRLMGVEVKWSPRMTLCAGVCSYEGRGGLCSVRLSTPLLKLRPRKDLIETLLHEMIHAYLFVTHNNTDHDGHGPQFHNHMFRINKLAGTKISVYHSFHDEVAVYRQHIWKCDGPCRKRPPYYGLVKRSMNRPPSPRDPWWEGHSQSCGGTYTKIKEPEGYGVKKTKRKTKDESVKDIRNYFPSVGGKKAKTDSDKENSGSSSSSLRSTVVGFPKSGGGESGGKVGRVDVQNASNSNIHGFGKPTGNISKTSGKNIPKNGSNYPKQDKNLKKGSTATGIRTASGSGTIVVRPKNKKASGTEESEKTNSNSSCSGLGSNIASFSGSGYVLGNSNPTQTRGRSRLLDEYDRRRSDPSSCSTTSTGSKNLPNNTGETITPSNTPEPPTICPLCQISINSNEFEEHIIECLGDLDQDSDFDSDLTLGNTNSPSQEVDSINLDPHPNKTFDKSKSTNKKDRDIVTLISDDDDEFQSFSAASHHPSDQSPQVLFPCPVCDEKFIESQINSHVNSHFS